MLRRAVLSLLPLALMACASLPPQPPAPRSAMAVDASSDRTWDAVIEVFADRNIPIRNMERVSGFISTDPLGVGFADGETWADCGTALGTPLGATTATYNVLVRGDSVHSTVKATVRWTRSASSQYTQATECSTKGVWEAGMEAAIKERAERKVAAKP